MLFGFLAGQEDKGSGKVKVILRVGSLCAGSGMNFAGTKALAHALTAKFDTECGLVVESQNVYACESSPWKRKFI